MVKLNAIQKKTMDIVHKYGFTFLGDSHFKSHRQATLCLNFLEREGFLVSNTDDYGRKEYRVQF